MSLKSGRGNLFFPTINRVKLNNFDLYEYEPNIEVNVNNSVFCLIGANGLGKTTFLNILNFAITGAIPDTGGKFQSAQEYADNCTRDGRSEDYFSGRVHESSRETASATVDLQWESVTLKITRMFFSNNGIAKLEVSYKDGSRREVYDVKDGTPVEEINSIYLSKVKELTGLVNFSEFIFLAHFILSLIHI